MFWRFGGYANISTLDTILDKPDVTLEELLDESDLIQELKQQNSKLVEFLREEPVLKKLLRYVVSDTLPDEDDEDKGDGDKDGGGGDNKPDDDKEPEKPTSGGISFFGKGKARSRSKSLSKKDNAGGGNGGETEQDKHEAQRKKYAYVACEVLSSEVWSITEALMEHQDDLREFWQYVYRPAPLDPLQAGYFTKVNETLLDKKTEEMLAFFQRLDGIVPAMLQHVDCPVVMDLLLKIISLEKVDGGAGIVDWLQSQDLIPLLLGFLAPDHNSAAQTSAGDFLKAIITISANATTQDQSVIGPNELTRQLVSEPCVGALIRDMLRGGNALTVGVGIIIEVIRKNNSDYDLDNQAGPVPKTTDPIYLGTLLRQFANHIPDFMHLIRSPAARKPGLTAAFGAKIEPLGFDRFKTCELMAELLHCSNMGLLNERGAEADVRKRDAERERLRAAGKLATPIAPTSPSHETSHDEFGSSVDSHGFHHARLPSLDDMDEQPEEIRRLEVQNASVDEDGFEKVNAPPDSADELPDDVSFDDFTEKKGPSDHPSSPSSRQHDPDMPRPLSPTKQTPERKVPGNLLHFDPPPTRAADSPTSAGVTERLGRSSIDEDTVMTELGEEPGDIRDHGDGANDLEQELANAAEKPAPLFARKQHPPPADEPIDPVHEAAGHSPDDEATGGVDQSVATIQGEPNGDNGERPAYEKEDDGSPVVGDFLKIQFVDHQVVPTILDFFFRFPWNNFLHNVVYDVVQQVFNGTLERGYNRTLAFDLFTPVSGGKDAADGDTLGIVSRKDITDRILDGQAASDKSQAEKGMRLGYMGHLTLIAEEVCKFGNRNPPESLDHAVLDKVSRPEWIQYVEGTLAETHEKDNAVLGGVRPENAIGMREQGLSGLGGGYTSNTASALASAGIGSGMSGQDSLALGGGSVGQSFEINSGTMLSGFGDGDDEDEDDEMGDEREGQRRGSFGAGSAFSDDEQASSDLSTNNDNDTVSGGQGQPSAPPPLNIPPSRARRQLAARLAAKKKEAEAAGPTTADPDAADLAAVETASRLPEEPSEMDALDRELEKGVPPRDEATELQLPGLRTGGAWVPPIPSGSASKFSGLFGSDSSSSSSSGSDGEDEAFGEGRDAPLSGPEGHVAEGHPPSAEGGATRRSQKAHRRPSTTEAKERRLLDDDDDDDDDPKGPGGPGFGSSMGRTVHFGESEGPFADPAEIEEDSDEDDALVEIRHTRRNS